MFGERRWWGSYEEVKLREQIRQARKGKLSESQKKHLTLSGVSLPTIREKKIEKGRPFQNLSAWWEGTAAEHQLEDFAKFLSKLAIVDLINIVAGLTIIISLGGWLLGGKEREEERIRAEENELFATRKVIQDLPEDKSGVVRVALERLLRNGFSLVGLPLSKTNLIDANLRGADLLAADLSKALLLSADLSGAILYGADLSETTLIEANLSRANLYEANLRKANLIKADLSGAILYEADLIEANLSGANLYEANLRKANLNEANLSGAILYGANLNDIKYNINTVWPEGFDPPPSSDGYDRNP